MKRIGTDLYVGASEQAAIRLKAHLSEEQYHHAGEYVEIVPLQSKSGTRIYVMAKPYILISDYTLNVALYEQPTKEGAIGEVLSFDWVGMKQQEIGQAQAWLYAEDRTLILWECFLDDWCRGDDPRTDEALRTCPGYFAHPCLWRLVERGG